MSSLPPETFEWDEPVRDRVPDRGRAQDVIDSVRMTDAVHASIGETCDHVESEPEDYPEDAEFCTRAAEYLIVIDSPLFGAPKNAHACPTHYREWTDRGPFRGEARTPRGGA